MNEDFAKNIKRKKIRKAVIAVILIAACVILALSLFRPWKSGGTGTGDTVSIEIRCDQLSSDMSKLNDKALLDYIPSDGIILPETTVPVEPGKTSVFDVTDKICREKDIQIEYSYSPGYDSHYIEGIHYIYEFSAGTYSGWLFTVDGDVADYGADKIILNGGEKIRWYYTVDYHYEDPDYLVQNGIESSDTAKTGEAGSGKGEADRYDSLEELKDLTVNTLVSDNPEPVCSSVGGEWIIKALASSGLEAPEGYYETYYDNLCALMKENDGVLDERRYTEYERVIIALSAIGKDPSDIAGYDITGNIDDYDHIVFQGVNAACYALISARCAGLPLSNEEAYIDYIIEGLSEEKMKEDMSYADYLAFGIEALAPYSEDKKAGAFLNEAYETLSALQNEDGSYGNSEATAEVIIALSQAGIDVMNDERYIKNGRNMYDGLMEYYIGEGRFKHLKEDEKADAMSCEKCALALDALCLFQSGRSLY